MERSPSKMSIARAFTTRRVRQTLDLTNSNKSENVSDSLPQRSKAVKMFGGGGGSIRHKISAPVKLTHTTNPLSFQAPDIYRQVAKPSPARTVSSSSKASDDESDIVSTPATTPPTSPETSFPEDLRSMSPEPNHLSCYFVPPKAATVGEPVSDVTESTAASSAAAAPLIPHRAPSHTKKSYDGLTRHRSVSRMSEQSLRSLSLSSKGSFSFSRSSSTSTHTSTNSVSGSRASTVSHHAKPSSLHASTSSVSGFSTTPYASAPSPPISHKRDYSESNPFGHELAKVSELVEEFGKEKAPEQPVVAAPTPANPVIIEEERELVRLGCKKYSAEDYLCEIQGLVASFLGDSRPTTAMWI
ncbi:hypothetical protein CMQ_7844 [Grosmannia clavigera kw1407]|uniref:Uncharacterized protein n=1 Tax=Grosmannia clavigera (strain kw1407 / UAMH 11150) TaxID=655863 RepID=F0XSE0_GROCL|nr:uncharacterized protein CMQ_7844 [Grosmannia clavigera kw1407]EFW99476.1 hypothetical protein CMQ_7844 [Grosmannia clavigera kw1407]